MAAPHFLSAEAGKAILEAGGNAVDAAVAIVAAQGVVAPETCGIGGDLFALIHEPGWDRPVVLNASGRAGSGANAPTILDSGYPTIPADHPAAVTIPGCVDGLVTLTARHGTKGLDELFHPAISLADDGFPSSTEQSRAFERQADVYRDNPAVAGFYPNARPVAPGDTVRRPDLARTLAEIADSGRAAFYEGTPASDIVAAVDGMISPEDLVEDNAEWVEPIGATAFGMECWTLPPNTQGYLGPGALAVFDMLDPPTDRADPIWWHLLVESYRCLAWERDDLVGDPDHLALPADLLLDEARLARAAETVDRTATGRWPRQATKPASTAYMCAVDSDGMTVSIINSNYRGTGSPFGAANSGFLLQDRGMGFNLTSGHPNCLGPGRRPLHTLSPTLWTRAQHPTWALGTRGGAVQPQLIAQMAARIMGLGDSPETAQRAPRWTLADFGPFTDSSLRFEPGVSDSILDDLRSKGHEIEVLDLPQSGWGPMSLIGIDGGSRLTAADPRVDTTAALVF